jgi:hypothetical protein
MAQPVVTLELVAIFRRDDITEAAARLLGVECVRLWHEKALYKEPGGRETDAQPPPCQPVPEGWIGRHLWPR